MEETRELRRLLDGAKVTQAISVGVTLGVPDQLADGARTSAQLASATGAHEASLYRLLRALAAVGVLREEPTGVFALTPLGEPLRSDHEHSLAGWAMFVGREHHWNIWGALLHSVRTGENAARHVLGESVWEYRARHPEETAIFDRGMTDLTRALIPVLLDAYDFSRFRVVVDVGGGHGALIAAILRAAPATRGILFDRAHVLAGAAPVLEAAGVDGRCQLVAGSFFEAVPPGADAYVLKSIIHDWSDDESVQILRVCRNTLDDDARVVVVERELGAPNENAEAKLLDLNMLLGPGGRERTTDEYAALFDASGLRLVGVTPTAAGFSLFEAAPA